MPRSARTQAGGVMTGKVAIITGGSQGIGAGLVAGYRGRGWAVVASARAIEPSEDPDLLTVAADITEPATGALIIDAALGRFGRIDTLVNNAGVFISKPFTDYTAADYATVVGSTSPGSSGLLSVPSPRWPGDTAATSSTSRPPSPTTRTPARLRYWPR
jgi:NAD(P)-dependent dehydrogenase (short-subunit alcohol dehydrogenase family)